MMKENERINEALKELRAEIKNLQTDQVEKKEKLEKLVEKLEKKLESPENAEHHHNLVEHLKESIAHFEVEHPRITGIINDLMVTLSNMGI